MTRLAVLNASAKDLEKLFEACEMAEAAGNDATRFTEWDTQFHIRIAEASHEIERALFFSTLIIVCAFIPLFSMTGPEGALFGPMANTYAFAIFGALLLAVTLTPVLCSFFFHNKREEKDTFIDRMIALGVVVVGGLAALVVFVIRRRRQAS